MSKQIVAVLTSLAVVTMLLPGYSVKALTADELRAQIEALQQQLAQLQQQLASLEGGSGSGAAASCMCTFTRSLYPGMTGDDVKCLQQYLNSAGYTVAESGPGSAGNETTYYGSLTRAAVKAWQDANGVEYGAYWGYFGPKSRAKYEEICASQEQGSEEQGGQEGGGQEQGGGEQATSQGLTVALASDNPAAGTIVADSTSGDGAQSLIPFVKVTFTNGDASDVKVTKLRFTRSGISADSDISQAYLYEGDTKVAEYSSFSSNVLEFSDASGLFTVPANGSKTVTLRADLANGTGSGKTIRFSIESASDVETDASAVNGSFPLVGNYMSTATASDLGKLTVANGTNPPSTVDPQNDFEVFNFTLAAADQKIEVRKLVFTNIGSTDVDDLQNFDLYDGGTLVASVVSMASDKTVTFDLTSDPIVIDKGITKNMHLKADIVGGTNRTFRFSFQNMTDIMAYDTQYGVYIKPNQSDSWTVVQAGNASTINTGKLTLSRNSDSPSGNVALGGTNVVIGKFDVKATGEDVKITQMVVRVYGTVGTNGLYQGKIYYDGSQKGSTTNLASASSDGSSAETTFSFGNTLIVPADGQTHTIEIKADIKKSDGTAYSGGETLTAKIQSVTAQGRESLQSISVGTATGYQLTIATGTLTAAKNQAVSNWTSSNPTGVPGATEVLVASFVVTAGSGEGASITAVKIKDSSSAFSKLQNVKVYQGTKESGTQIGDTQSSVSAGSTYTFYPSPYINLDASQQIVLNVYADIKTGASSGASGHLVLDEVDGTGLVTNNSANYTTDVDGQSIYIASAGSLSLSAASDQPKTAQVIMGTSDVVFNKIKFEAGAGEDIEVTQIVVSATLGGNAPTSSVKNIALYDGDTQVGSTVASLASDGTATFNLSSDPWVIPASSYKTLTIKADVNTYEYASSGASVALGLGSSGVSYRGAVSGTSGTAGSVSGNAMYTYKTVLTFAVNSSTPSGSSFPSVSQHLLYFDVTNEGSYDGYLNYATFTVSYTPGTGYTTTSASRTFYLYDSTDLVNAVGSATVSASTTINGMHIAIDVSPDYAIPAGQTKTFYLIGDTSDCGVTSGSNAGSRLQVYINSGTDVNWDDNVSSAVQSSYTKTFPLNGGVFTY